MKRIGLSIFAVIWILTLLAHAAMAADECTVSMLGVNEPAPLSEAGAVYVNNSRTMRDLSPVQQQQMQTARELVRKNVSNFTEFQFIMDEAFRHHIVHKELTPALTRDLLDSFINKLDPTGLVLFDSDRKNFVGAGERDKMAQKIFNHLRTGNVSHFTNLVTLYDHRLQGVLYALNHVGDNSIRERLLKITRNGRSEHYSMQPQNNRAEQKLNVDHALCNMLPSLMQADQMEFDDAIQVSTNSLIDILKGDQTLATSDERLYVLLAHAFISSLDAHSRFLTDAEAEDEFETGAMAPYRPLGVSMFVHPRGMIVATVAENSIADKAGLKVEDLILQINDVKLENADQMAFRKAWLKESADGRGGYKKVRMLVKRGDSHMYIELDPNSVSVIDSSQVKTERLGTAKGDMLYIQFPMFYQKAGQEIRRKVLAEIKKGPIKGVILDLRFNGGGRLDEASDIFSIFTSKNEYSPIWAMWNGTEVDSIGRREDDRTEGVLHPYPMVVMINGGSASASELVSGALKGVGRAVIVGTKQSFGKGTAQGPIPFLITNPDGSQILLGMSMLTQHFFFGAGGESPQFDGVDADVVLGGRQYDREGELERDQSFALRPPSPTPEKIRQALKLTSKQQQRKEALEQNLPQLRTNHEARLAAQVAAAQTPARGEDNLRKQALDVLTDMVSERR